MSTNNVIQVYDSMSGAETAVRKLSEGNFPIEQVSILAQDMASEKEVHGFITTGDVAKAGAGTGAWFGGLFGILVGAAFIWVPGFGPLFVAGPLAAALLGGVEGAVAGAAGGGLLGALFGVGISKQHIVKYEETLKAGKYLLVAHGSPEELELARNILADTELVEETTVVEMA
ncbi:MAG: hypothetical protein KC445_07690 [Anaerolineales bacterium]|nr:hypothetical protein [Anaerolineales bacterium]